MVRRAGRSVAGVMGAWRGHAWRALVVVLVMLLAAAWWRPAAQPLSGCPIDYQADWLPGRSQIHFDRDGLEAMRSAIGLARHSIDVSTFLLGGGFGHEVLRALDRQARAGVRVRLLYEDPANIRLGMAIKGALLAIEPLPENPRDAHFQPLAEALFAGELAGSPIARRRFALERFPAAPLKLAHDKLLVIDGQRAFSGGMNLDSSALNNHDAVIEVTGPAGAAAAAVFEHDWRMAGGEPGPPAPRPAAQESSVDADAAAGWPERMRLRITRPGCENQHGLLLDLLAQARRRVWLQMFYVTEPRLIKALAAARGRGVDVRVLMDPNEYSLGLQLHGAPNLAHMHELLEAGVALRLYRSRPGTQMHQKSLLVDDRWAVVGATNWTRQSFRVNTESAYLVDSPIQAARLADRFAVDWQEASVAPDPERMARRRLYAALLRRLSPYL